MEAQELHRGRLIDHLQLVVKDLEASRRWMRWAEAVFHGEATRSTPSVKITF